ncbi:MAG: PepSY-associated TM helix domain-containing protein [Deinococcus sp.]|uniref:PepSY-associated TM helix domain-containing protein n=1 Tax=Deinococcus sp. TaxID=47478 RepID=UPI0026DB2E34|nr:PepSY-associated TM helix domain-containing protein [Deinococcus sp.]MDO4246818.1 PepSY-associated TM helix domain-containing protein [Deinococcus sp.]
MSASPSPEVAARPARRPNRKAETNRWLRWLHTYTSMISLLAVLFFALTGITLNHPDWAFGTREVEKQVTGTLPSGWIKNGQVDWLTTAETLREQQNLHGRADEPRVDGTEASVTFLAPGYNAAAVIDTATGNYTVDILQQGAVAVMNDLHKGRDAPGSWKWLIDLSGIFLAVVALTGIGILLFLKKTRVQALSVMGLGSVLLLVLSWVALR